MAALVGATMGSLRLAHDHVHAELSTTASVDMIPGGGIDANRSIVQGTLSTFSVDIVLQNLPTGQGGLGAFNFDLVYDDTVIKAPDKVGGSSTNNNPLVNTGYTDSTGRSFNCFDPGIPSPKGDGDGGTGPGRGRAILACTSTGIPDGTEANGVVATITFDVLGGAGTSTSLAFENVSLGDPTGFVNFPATLNDGNLSITTPPTNTPAPTATATPPATSTSTHTATPTDTPLPTNLPDVVVEKTDLDDPVPGGGTIHYELRARNIGLQQADAVSIVDNLPGGTSLVSAPGCAPSGVDQVTCSAGTLEPNDGAVGGPDEAFFQVLVMAPNPGTTSIITNQAAVSSSSEPLFNQGNNSDYEDTVVFGPSPDLAILKTGSPSPVESGRPIDYTLTVHNAGSAIAAGVVVTDPLPAGSDFLVADPPCADVSGTVTCPLGALAANDGSSGGSDEAVLHITVLAPVVATDAFAVNAAVVTASNEPLELLGNNVDAFATIVLAPRADAAIELSDSPDPIASLGSLTMIARARSLGGAPLTGVTLEVDLPAGSSGVTAPAGCAALALVVTCSAGSLGADDNAPGGPDEAAFAISFVAPASPVNALLLTSAHVGASNEEAGKLGNNSDYEETVLFSLPANLTLSKTDVVDPVESRGTVTYLLTIRNIGSGQAQNVVVVDDYPDSMTVVVPGACLPSAGLLTCAVGPLAPNDGGSGGPDEAALSIQLQAPRTSAKLILTNVAQVSSDNESAGTTGDNTASATTQVNSCPDLNGDGIVNSGDKQIITANFNDRPGVDGNHDGVFGYTPSRDANSDGVLNSGDSQLIASNFNRHCPL